MIAPGDRVDIVCTLLYIVTGLSIMENVQLLWKHLYTMPVVSVTLYFGLKEINTAQKTYILISWESIGIYWKLLNPAT